MPEEVARLNDVDVDSGGTAYREVALWALRTVREAYERAEITASELEQLEQTLMRFRAGMGTMYDNYRLVLPINYLHLVSVMVYLYLALSAAAKAALFTPDADIAFGLVAPATTAFLLNFTTLGLLAIGSDFSNPMGTDDLDLAVVKFVSEMVISTKKVAGAPARLKEPPPLPPPPK